MRAKESKRASPAPEAPTEEVINSIKGFDRDLKCQGFQFEIGKTYEHAGEVSVCQSGFHAIEGHPFEVFRYYQPGRSRYTEVQQSGALSRNDGDSKVASARITIGGELHLHDLVATRGEVGFRPRETGGRIAGHGRPGCGEQHGQLRVRRAARASRVRRAARASRVRRAARAIRVRRAARAPRVRRAARASRVRRAARGSRVRRAARASRVRRAARASEGAASSTGVQGAASSTGDQGAASSTGDEGAASSTGEYGAASSTGDYGAASSTGARGAASSTGDYGAASSTGARGAASSTGDQGAASSTGVQGAASSTGDYGAASSTGVQGAASSTGYQGAASSTGDYGAASSTGYQGRVMGAEGNALFLVYRDPKNGTILHAWAGIVGHDGIKPLVWYSLSDDGKPVEVTP